MEVLVAIALLATVAAIVFGSLLTTTRVVDAGRAHAEREQTVRRILRFMADELSTGKQIPGFPWIGMNGTQEGQAADTVAFIGIGAGLGQSAAMDSESMRVVYTREGDRLMRFARRNLYGLTDESLEQIELADGVKGFNVRYFDGQTRTWTDEWLPVGKLPKAVLLEITFAGSEAEPATVREWVAVGAS